MYFESGKSIRCIRQENLPGTADVFGQEKERLRLPGSCSFLFIGKFKQFFNRNMKNFGNVHR